MEVRENGPSKMPPQTALGRILVPRRSASPPIGGLLVESQSRSNRRRSMFGKRRIKYHDIIDIVLLLTHRLSIDSRPEAAAGDRTIHDI